MKRQLLPDDAVALLKRAAAIEDAFAREFAISRVQMQIMERYPDRFTRRALYEMGLLREDQ